jgi:hypothetical protein
MSSNHHTVTVTTRLDDEGTEDEYRRVESVRFACTAPAGSECRTYPECDCEQFDYNAANTHDTSGHVRVSGRECWLQAWFDNEGAIYSGDDADDMRDDNTPAVDRTGHITESWKWEWVEWSWATPADTDEKGDTQ